MKSMYFIDHKKVENSISMKIAVCICVILLIGCSSRTVSSVPLTARSPDPPIEATEERVRAEVEEDVVVVTPAALETKTLLTWYGFLESSYFNEDNLTWTLAVQDHDYFSNTREWDSDYSRLNIGSRAAAIVGEDLVVHFVTTPSGSKLLLWDNIQNKILQELVLSESLVEETAFGLFYSYPGNPLIVLESESDNPIFFIYGNPLEIVHRQLFPSQEIYFSPDGTRLIIEGDRLYIKGSPETQIWDVTANTPVLLETTNDVNVAFSPDLQRYATIEFGLNFYDSLLQIKNWDDGSVVASNQLCGAVSGAPYFSPDGKYVIISILCQEEREYKVQVLDAETLEVLANFPRINVDPNTIPQFRYINPSTEVARRMLN